MIKRIERELKKECQPHQLTNLQKDSVVDLKRKYSKQIQNINHIFQLMISELDSSNIEGTSHRPMINVMSDV